MTLIQAIKCAARTAAKAPYSGQVCIYRYDDGTYGVLEFTDALSWCDGAEHIISIYTNPYGEKESIKGLEKYLREQLL